MLSAVGVLAIQSLLIAGLMYERRARRRAEIESRRNLALAADASRRLTMSALTSSIAHELGQPSGWTTHEQVVVVRHQAVGVDLDAEPLACLAKQSQELAGIVLRVERAPPGRPTIHHVEPRVDGVRTSSSRHRWTLQMDGWGQAPSVHPARRVGMMTMGTDGAWPHPSGRASIPRWCAWIDQAEWGLHG